MFENEGIKYALEETIGTECLSKPIEDFSFIDLADEQQEKAQCYKDGAEFGYNKANEWHYVKEELPELYKDVLVVFPKGDCDVKRLTNHNEWVGRGSWCSLTDVIAWKEIVPPNIKEIKENDNIMG